MEYLQSVRTLNQRKIRRDFILKNLEEVKVYPSLCYLRQLIWHEEEKEGLTGKMDRKSLQRIIEGLLKEKLVKFITMKITDKDEVIIPSSPPDAFSFCT
ncbi:unnamed protein product [Dibothriocephalus latus]|uniref:GTF3C1 extended winged-helix domain-containing protein n=1 Tax=Dibothriocephalus latus TaxID=60516 RepID=A0A3P7N6F9_DIBLA|nr:unnamed protein product [Dibothriocephalus latus]